MFLWARYVHANFFLIPPILTSKPRFTVIDLLMGLFRGAVSHHGGVPDNSPLALMGLRTLFPLTAFKNARNPKFFPAIVLGVPVRGTEIWKNLSENLKNGNFQTNFETNFSSNFSPPDWNPPKQSLGQVLDKFGASGVFEGCKGEKGSQPLWGVFLIALVGRFPECPDGAFSLFLGALKGTELRWQREPETQIFAEHRRFSQIRPFSWKFQHLEGAGNRRKPQIFARKPKIVAENRRKLQIGLRHLRSVTFSSALLLKVTWKTDH